MGQLIKREKENGKTTVMLANHALKRRRGKRRGSEGKITDQHVTAKQSVNRKRKSRSHHLIFQEGSAETLSDAQGGLVIREKALTFPTHGAFHPSQIQTDMVTSDISTPKLSG